MGTVQATGTAFGPRFDVGGAPWFSRLGSMTTAARVGIPLLLALGVFLPHSLAFRAWLVDDAGISFSYARSLAQGHGLVAQPGVPPVEGFSNPLWTLLLSGLFAAGMFDPAWTPKVLSFVLVAATFGTIAWSRGLASWPRAAAAGVAILLLSLNTGFVVWTSSGLENPLLAFLAALSCVIAARAVASGSSGLERAAGVVAGLLALTRPDAVVYAAAFPALLLSAADVSNVRNPATRPHAGPIRPRLRPFVGRVPAFSSVVFRRLAPNTFHAKEKPSLLGSLRRREARRPRPGRRRAHGFPGGAAPRPRRGLARRTPTSRRSDTLRLRSPGLGHRKLPGDAHGLDGRVSFRDRLLPLLRLVPFRSRLRSCRPRPALPKSRCRECRGPFAAGGGRDDPDLGTPIGHIRRQSRRSLQHGGGVWRRRIQPSRQNPGPRAAVLRS